MATKGNISFFGTEFGWKIVSKEFDRLDEEVMEGARSPLSGMDSAMAAGNAFGRRIFKHVSRELPAYLIVQSCWFMAFGLQMVLFPYLITNKLGLDGAELGLANMALAAPDEKISGLAFSYKR